MPSIAMPSGILFDVVIMIVNTIAPITTRPTNDMPRWFDKDLMFRDFIINEY